MNIKTLTVLPLRRALAGLVLLVLVALMHAGAQAQTAGGTQIQNRASASYSDGTNNYSTV